MFLMWNTYVLIVVIVDVVDFVGAVADSVDETADSFFHW